DFKKNFGDFRYAVGGAQSLPLDDPHVLGFVSAERHERNMRQFRVMYYHGMEPNHVHYHPFEAVRAGMPLVFMGGGLLDRMAGVGLPGRCASIREARGKIRRIIDGDRALIAKIRESQVRLLEHPKPENCRPAWRSGIKRIVEELEAARIPV